MKKRKRRARTSGYCAQIASPRLGPAAIWSSWIRKGRYARTGHRPQVGERRRMWAEVIFSVHVQSAVDGEIRSSDVSRAFVGQKGNGAGNVLGFA